jgi:hypothetical protein
VGKKAIVLPPTCSLPFCVPFAKFSSCACPSRLSPELTHAPRSAYSTTGLRVPDLSLLTTNGPGVGETLSCTAARPKECKKPACTSMTDVQTFADRQESILPADLPFYLCASSILRRQAPLTNISTMRALVSAQSANKAQSYSVQYFHYHYGQREPR